MSSIRAVDQIESRYEERRARHAERELEAWSEYLKTMRATSVSEYAAGEPLAWRRLRRRLAELAHDRRRGEFERDRLLAEATGYRLAG